jgi:exonuclease III
MNVLKIATLNINGLHTRTRVEMLHDFIQKQEIDVLFIQDVTHPNIGALRGHRMYTNVGTMMRGTAFVTREEMQLHNIKQLLSGRGKAADFRGIMLIKIYMHPPELQRGWEENQTDPRHVSTEWIFHPHFHFWPPR